MFWSIFNGFTLWLGMYTITCCLFWYETSNLATGLTMGLVSATLKTVWGLTHKYLTSKKGGTPSHISGEGIV